MLQELGDGVAAGIDGGRDELLVSIEAISKLYGSTRALSDVELRIRAGEVVGLLGANGAGKSTLLNILGGTVRPSSGTMRIEGEQVDFTSFGPFESRRLGIHRVFQELSTFDNLTVAENFALTGASGGRATIRRQTRQRLAEVFPGNRISVRAEVGSLSLAEQQMVEIARAATEPGVKLLILDEPTSALSAAQAQRLGDFVRERAAAGLAVIYVTHKLDEVLRLADRLVVLRDGRHHWEGNGRTATHEVLLEQLGASAEVRQELREAPSAVATAADEVLTVTGLSGSGIRDVSLTVRAGEIVGLAGLEGAGQRSLLRHIFARRDRHRGRVAATGQIAYVSGDRQREGILPLWSVLENVGISAVEDFSVAGFARPRKNRAQAREWLERLGLARRADSKIGELSGGNQQRALLGRSLASKARLLLLDDPTRGVDVGAKGDIYRLLESAKAEGRSALFYSTENVEFLQCDRVYVMAGGAIVAELAGRDATEERLLQASYAGTHATVVEPSSVQRVLASFGRFLTARPLPAAVLLAGMLVAVLALRPEVLNPIASNLLFQSATIAAFAAMAQLLFILGGDIDLGMGFAIGFVNVVGATLLGRSPVIAVLLLAALVAGYLLMAVLVEVFAVPAVVVTLGASFVWLGAGMLIQPIPGGQAPSWLSRSMQLHLTPIPETVYLLLIAIAIGLLIVRGWRYGTILRAAGSNPRTLNDLGHSSLRARMTLYGLSALLVIVTGLLVTATTGASDINASSPLTLSSVAAVIVGGASFAGGRVSPLGAVLAAVGLALISSVLVFSGVSSQYSTAIGGLVLIVVLGLRAFVRGVRE